VARNQLLTIFGTGLAGASIGFTAGGYSPASAGTLNAPVLYASPTQINFAVPLLNFSPGFAVMQLSVNGMPATPTEVPLDLDNPSLFRVVLNADGSQNSSSHPAPLGSTVSMFVNGLSGLEPVFPQNNNIPAQLYASGGWTVTNIVPATPFVLRVDLQAPSILPPNVVFCAPGQSPCGASMEVSLYYLDPAAGGATNVNAQAAEEPVFVLVP
jgi:uncharacterized protein (TIGR03437 family)